MEKAFKAFIDGKITRSEMYRYQELYKVLIGTDSFVEIGESLEWTEFQEITNKIAT
jgi:hypothetical protein